MFCKLQAICIHKKLMESEYQKEIVVNGVIYKNFGLAYK